MGGRGRLLEMGLDFLGMHRVVSLLPVNILRRGDLMRFAHWNVG